MSPRQASLFGSFIRLSLVLGAAVLGLFLFSFYSLIVDAKRAVLGQGSPSNSSAAQSTATPVLVELFTSEGCSSCPPADALLARLDRGQPVHGADIIVLEEHVDYWDSLGWKDRFSSPYLTERQKLYQGYFRLDDIYTPQTVVNGSAQFNGTDAPAIGKSIQHASAGTVPLNFTSVQFEGNTVRFTLENAAVSYSGSVRIYAALVDPEDTTEVRAGENHGRTLHHAGVVRVFESLGDSFHMNAIGKTPLTISARGVPKVQGMRLVVFAQTKPVGPVLAAASCSIEQGATAAPASRPDRCPATPTKIAFQPAQ
jgi:hypothetical protein